MFFPSSSDNIQDQCLIITDIYGGCEKKGLSTAVSSNAPLTPIIPGNVGGWGYTYYALSFIFHTGDKSPQGQSSAPLKVPLGQNGSRVCGRRSEIRMCCTVIRSVYCSESTPVWPSGKALNPFLTGRMFVRRTILRTLQRTMIRFSIELLVRRTWFGHFD